jgi:hypothetical protein
MDYLQDLGITAAYWGILYSLYIDELVLEIPSLHPLSE